MADRRTKQVEELKRETALLRLQVETLEKQPHVTTQKGSPAPYVIADMGVRCKQLSDHIELLEWYHKEISRSKMDTGGLDIDKVIQLVTQISQENAQDLQQLRKSVAQNREAKMRNAKIAAASQSTQSQAQPQVVRQQTTSIQQANVAAPAAPRSSTLPPSYTTPQKKATNNSLDSSFDGPASPSLAEFSLSATTLEYYAKFKAAHDGQTKQAPAQKKPASPGPLSYAAVAASPVRKPTVVTPKSKSPIVTAVVTAKTPQPSVPSNVQAAAPQAPLLSSLPPVNPPVAPVSAVKPSLLLTSSLLQPKSTATLPSAATAAVPTLPKPTLPVQQTNEKLAPVAPVLSQPLQPNVAPAAASLLETPQAKTSTSTDSNSSLLKLKAAFSASKQSLAPAKPVTAAAPAPTKAPAPIISSTTTQTTQSQNITAPSKPAPVAATSKPVASVSTRPSRGSKAAAPEPQESDTIILLMDSVSEEEKSSVKPFLWNAIDLAELNRCIDKINEFVTAQCLDNFLKCDFVTEKEFYFYSKLDDRKAKAALMLLCTLKRLKMSKSNDETVYKITPGAAQ